MDKSCVFKLELYNFYNQILLSLIKAVYKDKVKLDNLRIVGIFFKNCISLQNITFFLLCA